jgi:MFS family permease
VVGPAIGGCLALISLRATFLASSAALLFGGLAILISSARRIDYGPHERAPHSGCDEDDEGLSALIPAIRDGRLARLLVWLVLFEIASNWLESVIPLYAHDAGTLPSSGVGMLFAYAAVLVVALQMPVARLAKDWPAPKVLTGAGVATAVAFLLLAASPSLLCLILSVTLCALAQMFMGPLIPLTLSALAPLSRRASYMAASSVAVDLKDTLGPSLGTLLYAVAPRLPWIAGIPVVALASLGLGVEMRRNRTAVQPNRAARPVS